MTGRTRPWARLRSRAPRSDAVSETPIPFALSREIRAALPELVEHPGASGIRDTHFRHPKFVGGICCTPGEAILLHESAGIRRPTQALEIGSYVGWTTVHIAKGIMGTLDCVEPFLSGGKGSSETRKDEAVAYFWSVMRRCGVDDRIRLSTGESPEVLPEITPVGGWEYAFVDGWHQDGQPLRDVRALLWHVTPDCLIVLHDLWVPDVRDAALFLIARGFRLAVCPTANYLTFATRAPESSWWPGIVELSRDPEFRLQESVQSLERFGLGQASLAEWASSFRTAD